MSEVPNGSPEIEVTNLWFHYPNGENILRNISLRIPKGGFTGIIGPNGCGKTTLIRCIAKSLLPVTGDIRLAGQNIKNLSSREIARKIAVVPQKWEFIFPFTAADLVMMGRFPHIQRFHGETGHDQEVVAQVMGYTNTLHLRDRLVTEMSGGELQRVIIAQALAQSPQILLLDEPTSFLDINHQIEILEVIRGLSQIQQLTVITVFHDLNLASHFCDDLVLLKSGSVLASGSPGQVLTGTNLEQAYDVKARINMDPLTAKPFVRIYPVAYSAPIGISGLRIHVIGGGGATADLLEALHFHGFQLSCGVLNIMDSDWMTAKELQVKLVETPPFGPITPEAHQTHLAFIKEADIIILGNIPFGSGNSMNLEAALDASQTGKPVFVCDFTPISRRDFTGGSATERYARLQKSGAIYVRSNQELLETLKKLKIIGNPEG